MIDLTAIGSTNRDLASVMPGGFIKFSGDESTTKIEYNTKLLFTGSSAATLTLSSDAFQGCNVVISNIGSANLTVNSTFSNSSKSFVLNANAILNLTFMNGKWHFDSIIVSDGSEQRMHDVNINGTATISTVNELKTKIDEEVTSRTEADTELGTRIDGEVEARTNADSELDGKITSTNNIIGQLESLKTTDKSSTIAAINEVYDSVQYIGSTGNTAINCEQFTYVVDSDLALADWAHNDRSKGQDYTSVLIKKGEWTSTIGVNLTNAGTRVVVGEAGSKLVFNIVEKGLFYNSLQMSSEYYMTNVNVSTSTATRNAYGFFLCNNLTNCTGMGISSDVGCGFMNCRNLTNCTGTSAGTNKGYGFFSCRNLTNCTGVGTGTSIGHAFFNCKGVFHCNANDNCTTSVFNNSYASNSNTVDYACADTPAGGFNDTTNPPAE